MKRFLRRVRWAHLVPRAAFLALRLRGRTEGPLPPLPPCGPARPGRPAAGLVAAAVRRGTPGYRCVVRSLVLARLLRRYGYPATVVIGLPEGAKAPPEVGPFAHAWVELEDDEGLPGYEELGRIEV